MQQPTNLPKPSETVVDLSIKNGYYVGQDSPARLQLYIQQHTRTDPTLPLHTWSAVPMCLITLGRGLGSQDPAAVLPAMLSR